MKLTKRNKNEYLNDIDTKRHYDINCTLQNLSSEINKIRLEKNITQKELASRAGITQQQLSKVELGANCNMSTFISVALALGATIGLVGISIINNKQDNNVSFKDKNPVYKNTDI